MTQITNLTLYQSNLMLRYLQPEEVALAFVPVCNRREPKQFAVLKSPPQRLRPGQLNASISISCHIAVLKSILLQFPHLQDLVGCLGHDLPALQ